MAAWGLILKGDLAGEALTGGGFDWSKSCSIFNLGWHFIFALCRCINDAGQNRNNATHKLKNNKIK